MDGQVTWFDLGISFGRTLSEHSAATEDETSTPCWKKLRVSQNQDFLYLDCRKSGNGQKQEPLTVMGGLSLGELTTLKTGEKPSETAVQEMLSVWGPHSVAEESRLSQILEANPLSKYNLTAKACLGLLRRAERRGKDLPERLKAVLLMQSASGGGCDGGGKGALVQTEKSGTLGTGNDQTIFCLQGNSIDRADTAGCNGKGWKTDESYTLNTIDRHAVCAEVACMNPWDAQSARVYDQDGAWHSLNANENGGMARDSVLCAGFKLGNSEKAHSIGYKEETSPTLNAECGGNKPAVVALDMTHACDVIRECGEQAPSLQARMGTGGNQVPLTYQMNGFGDYRAAEVASSCKQRDFKDSTDLAIINMVVRRLTPMECERLQGFPDGWTDIGDWIKTDKRGREIKVKGSADSPRYKALGNSIALPFWDWMLRRMARYLPEGATLGSLFDGIGGFPLIFERIHGKGTARWASEIEPFPIAVTKKWFGEE
jgi:DNA (cytosine-5)-methyltransferase 1